MHTNSNTPWRRHTKTEPMSAVEIAEIELEQVTGGCERCGNPQHQASQHGQPPPPTWRR